MKAILEQYAAYNIWANQKLTQKMLLLPDEFLKVTLPSSFASLYLTTMHMLDAESIWWQRLKMQDNISRPGEQYNGNTSDLVAALLHQNTLWLRWIENASPAALEHVFHYQNSKKEKFRQPTYEMLLHLFNHGTYHRGQLVTMLRNLKVESIPATDFIIYSRSKK